MVRIHPDPPEPTEPVFRWTRGAIAQLGERLLCKQEVTGSIPVGSTSLIRCFIGYLRCTTVRSLEAISSAEELELAFSDRMMSFDIVLLFNNPESFCFDAKFSSE